MAIPSSKKNPIQVGTEVVSTRNERWRGIYAFDNVGVVVSINGHAVIVDFENAEGRECNIRDLVPTNAIYNGIAVARIGKASHHRTLGEFPIGAKVMLVNPSPRHGIGSVKLGEIGVVEKHYPLGYIDDEDDDGYDGEPFMHICFPDSYGEGWSGVPSDLVLVERANHKLKGTLSSLENL